MSIKEQKQSGNQEFQLDNYEYDFIAALATARNNSYNGYQATISSFLAYLGGSKWGLPNNEVVDFSLNDEKKTVTVSPHKDS